MLSRGETSLPFVLVDRLEFLERMAALLVTRAGFPGAASTRHRELRGLHPKGKARPDSRHRKLLQLWLADEAVSGGGETIEFYG